MHKKSYDELEFTDDFLFCHIMMANEDLCIEIAEMITDRKIKSILKSDDQKSVSLTYDGKGVRFDVYFEDEDNVIYDIEMQAVLKGNLQKRTRYYQGMIDLNTLRSGKDYNDLNESYLIFICNFAMFENKRHIYTFENICREDREILLGDGSHRIFLCAEGEADDCSDKMKDFLNYVAKREVKGELSQKIRREVEESRKHEKWRLDYMTLLEHYKEEREEGRKEGLEEGRKEGLEEGLKEGRTEERKNGIRIFIEDKLEDNTPKCKIVDKLVKNYDLTAEEADEYITQYSTAIISAADNSEG